MTLDIKQEADGYFDWPSAKREHVTFTSCMLFAKHCVDKSQQWRPIDDDAKSGKPVFVLEKGVPLKACFIKKFAMEASDTYDGEADYSEELDEYYWPEGWYEWNQHEDTHWALDSEPTHYMNIPPAPEAA